MNYSRTYCILLQDLDNSFSIVPYNILSQIFQAFFPAEKHSGRSQFCQCCTAAESLTTWSKVLGIYEGDVIWSLMWCKISFLHQFVLASSIGNVSFHFFFFHALCHMYRVQDDCEPDAKEYKHFLTQSAIKLPELFPSCALTSFKHFLWRKQRWCRTHGMSGVHRCII